MDSKLEQLRKKIEGKENELSKIENSLNQLQEKRNEKNNELEQLRNEAARYELKEINVILGKKGMKLSDIIKAVKENRIKIQ